MTKQTNGQADAEAGPASRGRQKRARSGTVQDKAGHDKAGQDAPVTAVDKSVLLNTTPNWLNWGAVTLAVLIVAGIFVLSARQLSAPQDGVSANQLQRIQAGVGGMLLDTDATSPAESNASSAEDADASETAAPALADVQPGRILMNPRSRVELYADADPHSSFLDSYARGGTFIVMEPTGDFMDYPVVVNNDAWVRVRAADGLVGWTPAAELEPAP